MKICYHGMDLTVDWHLGDEDDASWRCRNRFGEGNSRSAVVAECAARGISQLIIDHHTVKGREWRKLGI